MWPHGTGQWDRTQIVIVSANPDRRAELLDSWAAAHPKVVATPLELLRWLELHGPSISTVVLSDVVGSASMAELADFLEDHYPFVRVVMSRPGDHRGSVEQPHWTYAFRGD